jgi:hypothetical protein
MAGVIADWDLSDTCLSTAETSNTKTISASVEGATFPSPSAYLSFVDKSYTLEKQGGNPGEPDLVSSL